MLTRVTTLLTYCLIGPLSILAGEAFTQIDSLTEVEQHLRPNSLILLDIDLTILDGSTACGSNRFFYDTIEKAEDENTFLEMVPRWSLGQKWTTPVPMEPDTAKTIEEWQERGYVVMGLTHRPPYCSFATLDQLSCLGIDLSRNCPFEYQINLDYAHSPRLMEGVVFVHDCNPKGDVLELFLGTTGYRPAHVIFVDDRQSNLASVQRTLDTMQIPNAMLHYTHPGPYAEEWSREVALLQEQMRDKILSDEMARLLVYGTPPQN